MAAHPEVLGLKRSFGFGDRLGLATPGHMDAVKGSGFAPIFAQQSIREMRRTKRAPAEVMDTAVNDLAKEGWTEVWGSDADHLQTQEDIQRTAEVGFNFFTIDPSLHVNADADELTEEALESSYIEAATKNDVDPKEVYDLYLGKAFTIDEGSPIAFDDRNALTRAFVKYGPALLYTQKMFGWITEACGGRPFEVEMSVDETPTPTSLMEHLYIGLELNRLGVELVSLAPRFIGDFEKGIDYRGDLSVFEAQYARHVAIAKFCGPYKLSLHSGSDKFKIYPIAARLSGELLHVKTAGTSYLEALRVVCRTDKQYFREIIEFCRGRFETDKATYHISAKLNEVSAHPDDDQLEEIYLNQEAGRQILHVTFGSILSGETGGAPSYKDRLLDNLNNNLDLYREVLAIHLGKHIQLLK